MRRRPIAAAVSALALLAMAPPARPQIAPPAYVAYQARITDASDVPINGTRDVKFVFYNASTGGTVLLTNAFTAAPVANGLMTVLLGQGTLTAGTMGSLADVFRKNPTVYLEIQIYNGTAYEVLAPRAQLVSNGYALNAGAFDGQPSTFYLNASNIGAGTLAAARLPVVDFAHGGTGTSTTFALGSITFSDGTKLLGNAASLFWDNANKRLGVGTNSPQASLDIVGDGATVLFPRKSTAGDPTGVNGMLYYNSTSNKFRIFEGSAWKDMSIGGAVMGVTASAPLASSGGATPNISLTGAVDLAHGGTGSTSFALGAVTFSNGSMLLGDAASLYWDNTNKRLGIGIATPAERLSVAGIVQSTTGGFKFPDGTVQNTAGGGKPIVYGYDCSADAPIPNNYNYQSELFNIPFSTSSVGSVVMVCFKGQVKNTGGSQQHISIAYKIDGAFYPDPSKTCAVASTVVPVGCYADLSFTVVLTPAAGSHQIWVYGGSQFGATLSGTAGVLSTKTTVKIIVF